MKTLLCDISVNGSTEQFLTHNRKHSTRTQFVDNVKHALSYRAKTKPTKIARRLACLIGTTYDQLRGDPVILDIIIEAFNELEKDLNK